MRKHLQNLLKRIVYNYFLRDMTLASVELVVGCGLLLFGVIFGSIHWLQGIQQHTPAPFGTIMLSALPILIGLQFVLAFLGYDMMVSIPGPEAIPGGNLCGFNEMSRLIRNLEGWGQKSHGKSHGQSNRKPEPVKIFITPS